MKIIKFKKAFSLIELSIIILFIGIVIASVSQSSRLINEFRISSAKTLTENSAVGSINGLILWLEPLREESFLESQTDNGAYISRWNDINPQANYKNDFTKSSAESTITYVRDAINHLPALYFNGSDGTSVLTSTAFIRPSSNGFTLFAVFELDENPLSNKSRFVFYSGNSGTNGFGYLKNNAVNVGERAAMFGGVAWNRTANADSTTNPEIITLKYNSSATLSMYVNGSSRTLYDTATMINPNTSAYVGAYPGNNASWKGYIAEIIVFDRALKDSERTEIQKYLSKKYGIALSS